MAKARDKHRLHALCPYFAMFPESFAREQILAHSSPGDLVLDPFSGRGTTLLESLLLDRDAVAVDINPVAACVTGAKARVPYLQAIETKLQELEGEFNAPDVPSFREERRSLPAFFRRAFHYRTLEEILFLRRRLDWTRHDLDRFVAALCLGSLHGEMDRSSSYFSNQMPRTISTKPDYSVRYWRARHLWPKRRRTFHLLTERALLRLSNGVPVRRGLTILGDARLTSRLIPTYERRAKLVVTSPPYLDVTSYEEDQWLRLWFLGGAPKPTYSQVSRDDRHTSSKTYWEFLAQAWRGVAPLLAPEATIVCRIGSKRTEINELGHNLIATIQGAIPSATFACDPIISAPRQRQTDNFRPGTAGCGYEVDFIFRTG